MISNRPKRILFGCATAAIVLLVAEAIGYLAIGLIAGVWFSPGVLQQSRLERTGQSVLTSMQEQVPKPRWVRSATIHPFVGFVEDPAASPGDVSGFGYYEDEPPLYRRSPGHVILGVFGGSFAHQFRAEAIDALVATLQQDPRFAGREFVVTSTALGGYKQPQQLMVLNWLLALGGEFDIVLNIDGFNEVALHEVENRPHNVFPAYPRSWYYHALGVGDGDLVDRAGKVRRMQHDVVRISTQHARAPWRWSGLANLVWLLRDREHHARLVDAQEALLQYQASGQRYAATGPLMDQSGDDAVYSTLVELWKQSSLQMARLCEANDVLYVHALQPNQYVEGSKPLSPEERRFFFRADHPYRAGVLRAYDRLRAAGEELKAGGVRFLDLTQLYSDVPETLYTDDCCHVSQQGYLLVADPLAEAILELPATP